MRTLNRKPGKYTHLEIDMHITAAKFNELKAKFDRLKTVSRPYAIEEVKRLALMGDFSENAAYQIAKGRLRGINTRMLEIDNVLKRAIIIEPNQSVATVRLGHSVTIETGPSRVGAAEAGGKQKTYQILGSAETNPGKGIISHNSPIGSALMGKRVGDTIKIPLADKTIEYKIIEIK